jgi:ribosomal protein S18
MLNQTKQTIYEKNMKTFKQFIKESENIMPKSKTIYTAVPD